MSAGQRGSVLLTGAAGGMGTAIAKALVEAGYQVVLVDRDEKKVADLARTLGPATTPLVVDITDGKSVSSLPEQIPERFRPIDILINNAGMISAVASVSIWDRPMTGPQSSKRT